MDLTTAQRDRAVGAVLGMATGDALGMGYEFGPPVPAGSVTMKRNPWLPRFEPGEWTDDTTMAVPILHAVAQGRDLLDPQTQDYVAGRWVDWAESGPKDIGVSTCFVLGEARSKDAQGLAEAARARYLSGAGCAGNGSLMRTTAVVLGHLDDPAGLTRAARTYSDLTHGDPEAADACVLWNHAQRHAILHAEFDLSAGLAELPAARRDVWARRIAQAGRSAPVDFTRNNGWAVAALQCAWAAITSTPADGPEHLERGVRAAVGAGHDTDTVAAIAGGLLGARWGVSAIPLDWRCRLFGWPGWTGEDLVQAAVSAVSGHPWPGTFYEHVPPGPAPVQLPHDAGVWLGDVAGLRGLPASVDSVVSLCRIGSQDAPPGIPARHHAHVWLMDSVQPDDNEHLSFVVEQTVGLLQTWRCEGRTVYLHCVQARSRTPFIAAAYAARITGRPALDVLGEVLAVLPGADPNSRFRAFLASADPG